MFCYDYGFITFIVKGKLKTLLDQAETKTDTCQLDSKWGVFFFSWGKRA